MNEFDLNRLDQSIADLRKDFNDNFNTVFALMREMSGTIYTTSANCPRHEKDIGDNAKKIVILAERLDAMEKRLIVRETESATAKRTVKWLSSFLYAIGGAFGGNVLLKLLEALK